MIILTRGRRAQVSNILLYIVKFVLLRHRTSIDSQDFRASIKKMIVVFKAYDEIRSFFDFRASTQYFKQENDSCLKVI